MSILTSQVVHNRNWTKCPRCDGGAVFTERDRKQGATCTYCDGKGEIPRFANRRNFADNSSVYEQQAGA